MVTEAFAQTAQGAGSQPGGSLLVNFIPILAMFAIFYFILIRPQVKKQKAHASMLEDLKEGDNVITSGGLYGSVVRIKEDVLTLQIAENVRVKVARTNIGSLKTK